MPSGYRVIYPRGDRTKLDVAWVKDYEEGDWAIASRQNFYDDEGKAREYAKKLAKEHGKHYVGYDAVGSDGYLD